MTVDGPRSKSHAAYRRSLAAASTPDILRNPQFLLLERYLPKDLGSSILDAGCGTGVYARALEAKGYRHIIGVDMFDPDEVGLASEGSVRYRKASIDDTGLHGSSIDLLYSFSVIYHLPDPRTAIAEFRRVMKPGAVLVFSAHTRFSLFTLDRIIRRRLGGVAHLQGATFHSAGTYARLLRAAGFEVLEVDGYHLNYFRESRIVQFLRTRLRVLRRSPPPTYSVPWKPGTPWLRAIRSIFGYHLLIVARKLDRI